jgi:hypothetical protein
LDIRTGSNVLNIMRNKPIGASPRRDYVV